MSAERRTPVRGPAGAPTRRPTEGAAIPETAMRRLKAMALAHAEERWDEAEIVREGRRCYLGCEQVSCATVEVLLRYLALGMDDSGGCERYAINGTGLAIAADPGLAARVAESVGAGRPFTVVDGHVVPMDADDSPFRAR